jgi:hypothetical protein
MPSPIIAFMHCGQCVREKPKKITPADWAKIEVGLDEARNIIVWCRRHDRLVTRIKLNGGGDLPPLQCAVGGHSIKGHSGDD